MMAWLRRDRMANNRAVVLDIDTIVIASYDAAGVITPGAGVTIAAQ